MIKNFSIFKYKKPRTGDKAPTHGISTKIGDEFVEIGACWTKESSNGDKYLSCALQKAWVDHTDRSKTRIGFAIVDEKTVEQEPPEAPPEAQNDTLDAF
jgi:hypothetical protein